MPPTQHFPHFPLPIIESAPYIPIEVPKASVDAVDVTGVVLRISELTPTRQHVQALAGKLVLMFDGFDDDPRELFEIAEFRAYYQSLFESIPHLPGLLMADPRVNQLKLMMLALSPVTRTDQEGTFFTSFDDLPHAKGIVKKFVVAVGNYYQENGVHFSKAQPMIDALGMLFPGDPPPTTSLH